MGLNDIATVSVNNGPAVTVSATSVSLTMPAPVATSVTVQTAGAVGPLLTAIETGPQGRPGLQNVFVQSNDPAVENGWGPEQTNYIWIKI